MSGDAAGHRLVRYGIILFLASLIEGMLIPLVTNPRMGLSAHMGGLMAGMFLAVVGLLLCHGGVLRRPPVGTP